MQLAYARRLMSADGENKKQMALNCGYSPNVARSIKSHIENKPGFHNAMAALALDSNNLALAAIHEFKSRGFKDFSNKDLINALNAIGSAWSKFNTEAKPKDTPSGNRLRTVILQQIENQSFQMRPNQESTLYPIAASASPADTPPSYTKEVIEDDPMDF